MATECRLDSRDDRPHSGSPAVLDAQAIERLRELDPGGKNQLLVRIADAFGTSVARLVPQMTAAVAARDLAAIRHVAHTLKSSSASIGAVKLSRLCADIEAICREGRGEDLANAIAEFDPEVSAAQCALNQMLERSS